MRSQNNRHRAENSLRIFPTDTWLIENINTGDWCSQQHQTSSARTVRAAVNISDVEDLVLS